MLPTDPTGAEPPPPSSPYVGVPAEAVAPAPRRSRRLLKVGLAVLGTVVLVGVPSAVALYMALNRASEDQLVRMVPANADVYSTVLLDPSLSQKRNLYSFLQHFPQLRTQQDIQQKLDSALNDGLKSAGLNFTRDVQPWLGNQVAVSVHVTEKSTGYAFLMRTTNEHQAAAAMDKAKSGDALTSLRWSTTVHDGVTVTNGVEPGARRSSNNASYAVFDHAVVMASDEATLDAVIDTDHGRQANLSTQAAYQQTLAQLPSDHIGMVYVNAATLLGLLKKTIAPDLSKMPQPFRDLVSGLDAYRSFGAAVSAQSDAMALDAVTLTDPNRMTAAQRQALASNARRAAALDWVPQDSYAVLAATGPASSQGGLPLVLTAIVGLTVVGRQTTSTFSNISNGLDQSAPAVAAPPAAVPQAPPSDSNSLPPDYQLLGTPPPWATTSPPPPPHQVDPLQQLGLSGADGIQKHLTGDGAIAVGPSHGDLPVSAVIVLGTDDAAAIDQFLQKLATLSGTRVTWGEQHDGNAVIHTLQAQGLDGVEPSYAVVDGYAVIGTDADAVRHSIDAHRASAGNITGAAGFRSSAAANAVGGLLFVDVRAVASAIRNALSGSDRADFDTNIAPDLAPLRTFVVTTTADTHKQTTHMVVTVGG